MNVLSNSDYLFRYAKSRNHDWTQLQFEFTSVPVSANFPLGAKTIYRKYSQDEIILIEKCDRPESLGFKVMNAIVTNQPEAREPDIPEGMYILKDTPPRLSIITPEPFVQGSKELLDAVVNNVERQFRVHAAEVVQE